MVDVAYERITPRVKLSIVREENWLHVLVMPKRSMLIRVAIGDDENLEAVADQLSANGYPEEADRVRVLMIEARHG